MKNYTFVVRLAGVGETPEEAWEDCVEGFMMDPGPAPSGDEIEDIEEVED